MEDLPTKIRSKDHLYNHWSWSPFIHHLYDHLCDLQVFPLSIGVHGASTRRNLKVHRQVRTDYNRFKCDVLLLEED